MSKFLYRMQNILNLKRKLEEQAKMEYGAARARLNEEEEKLAQLQGRKADYEEEARSFLKKKLDLQKMRENKEAILRMDEFIELQKEEIQKAEDVAEAAREKLQAAIQERKIHEKLRENAFEAFLLEEKAGESRQIDELTSYTYGQRQQEAAEVRSEK